MEIDTFETYTRSASKEDFFQKQNEINFNLIKEMLLRHIGRREKGTNGKIKTEKLLKLIIYTIIINLINILIRNHV